VTDAEEILAALAGLEARVVATMAPLEAKVDALEAKANGIAKAVAERAGSGNGRRTMIVQADAWAACCEICSRRGALAGCAAGARVLAIKDGWFVCPVPDENKFKTFCPECQCARVVER
jgi:hypothetical protein